MPKRLNNGMWESQEEMIKARKSRDNIAKKRRYWRQVYGIDVADSQYEEFARVSRKVAKIVDHLPFIQQLTLVDKTLNI